MASDSWTSNPLYTLPLFVATAFVPIAYGRFRLVTQFPKAFDNVNPRGHKAAARLEKNIGPEWMAFYERCSAAHANGLEALAIFAPAVLAARQAGVSDATIAPWAYLCVVLRVIYNLLYINTTRFQASLLRTLVYHTQFTTSMGLFIAAARHLSTERLAGLNVTI